MRLLKTQVFLSDLEQYYTWYLGKAGASAADHYLAAVERTCESISQQPLLGPALKSSRPLLQGWRFFVVFRPFQKHLVFYEIKEEAIVFHRAMHGHRDLLTQLETPPGA